MSRMFSKQWSDKKPFTRRVRWYCDGPTGHGQTGGTWSRDHNIRLQFEDSEGKQHVCYGDDKTAAELDWAAFKAGTLTTTILRNRRT